MSSLETRDFQDPHAVGERVALVARLNSARVLRSRTVPDQPKLVFKELPAADSDPPGELDRSKGDGTAYSAYQDWLNQVLWKHGDLPPLGDKDADGRYTAEVRCLRTELARLAAVKTKAWSRLINEQLFNYDADPDANEPDLFALSESIATPLEH